MILAMSGCLWVKISRSIRGGLDIAIGENRAAEGPRFSGVTSNCAKS